MAAVKTVSDLKGVGPATATMVLQVLSDSVPFMSDEAMLQIFGGDKTKLKYDVKTCTAFIEKIYEVVESLDNGMSAVSKLTLGFTAADVERALFAKEILGSSAGNAVKSKHPSASISPPPTKAQKRQISETKDDAAAVKKPTSEGSRSSKQKQKEDENMPKRKSLRVK